MNSPVKPNEPPDAVNFREGSPSSRSLTKAFIAGGAVAAIVLGLAATVLFLWHHDKQRDLQSEQAEIQGQRDILNVRAEAERQRLQMERQIANLRADTKQRSTSHPSAPPKKEIAAVPALRPDSATLVAERLFNKAAEACWFEKDDGESEEEINRIFDDYDKTLKQCAELDPDGPFAHVYKASQSQKQMFIANNDAIIEPTMKEVLTELQAAVEKRPQNPFLIALLAMEVSTYGNTIDACKLYEQAIKLRPTSARLYACLAAAQERLGDHAKSIASNVRAIELTVKNMPMKARLLGLLGERYLKAGKGEQAKNAYEAAVKTDPTNEYLNEQLKELYQEITQRHVTFEFVDTSLNDAVVCFETLTKLKMVLNTSIANKKVSIRIVDMPFEDALIAVVEKAGAGVRFQNGHYVIFSTEPLSQDDQRQKHTVENPGFAPTQGKSSLKAPDQSKAANKMTAKSLLSLARQYMRIHEPDKAEDLARQILKDYPNAAETESAKEILGLTRRNR